jgi:hypothetical protein
MVYSNCWKPKNQAIILETAVGSACIVQSIDLSGVSGKIAVTLLVIRFFPDMPDESIDCAMHALPTAVSRIINNRYNKQTALCQYQQLPSLLFSDY